MPDVSKNRGAFILGAMQSVLADNSTPKHLPNEPPQKNTSQGADREGGGVGSPRTFGEIRCFHFQDKDAPPSQHVPTTPETQATVPGILEHCARYEHVLGDQRKSSTHSWPQQWMEAVSLTPRPLYFREKNHLYVISDLHRG